MSWQYDLLGDDLSSLLRDRSMALRVPQSELMREAVEFYLRCVTGSDVLLEARVKKLRAAIASLKRRRRYSGRYTCGACDMPGHNVRTCREGGVG